MDALGQAWREWLCRQTIAGQAPEVVDNDIMRFHVAHIMGQVAFLPFPDGREAVRLSITRSPDIEPSFLARFVLDDEWRARELFREMAAALEAESRRGAVRVLVCCSAETSSYVFVDKLRTAAQKLSIAYDFEAMPAEEAVHDRGSYAAVLLAPQVSHLQQQIFEAHRDAVTFSIPPSVFATGNAPMAIRLLLEALGEIETSTATIPAQAARPLSGNACTLIINVMYCDRCVRVGYRIYQGQKVRIRSAIIKGRLSLRDIDDLIATLPLSGIALSDLEAICFVMPGVVNFCSMNLPSMGDRDYCLAEKMEKRYGIPVYMDNNTNAAALGCYLLDAEHESLTLYRHQLGHKNGGQGTVIGGHLVTGRFNLAGEPKFYQRRFKYAKSYSEAVWSAEGLSEICGNVLLASIGTISPDVAYLAVSTVDDMCSLHSSLERVLPKYCIPELERVDDYRDRMYLGAVELCQRRLLRR